MKWRNKGNELDMYAETLLLDKSIEIFVFGCGIIGSRIGEILKDYDVFKGYIDNDIRKQGCKKVGREVYSLDAFLYKKDKAYIVIAASKANEKVIEKQLKEKGLFYGKDYFFATEFLQRIWPIIYTYLYNKVFVNLAQISLTERCTLKCKKCAHACYAVVNDAKDLSLDEVYKSADAFFSKVDYIQEFVLIGGEPLLYKDLSEAISYIGERYRKQINIFCITTNGTILPSEEVLEMCKKYNVFFSVSNYVKQLPKLKKHYARLIKVLEDNNIAYVLGREETEWMDYGFEYVNREDSEEELIKVFSSCNTPCREVRGNKYYYCVMARSVSENLGLGVGQEDFLDLDKLTDDNYKKVLLEFNLGYSQKGYLDMCRHCHGNKAKNYPIPAAEQVER
mgnify:CR=1 FL=1